ncbi:MAG: hypothetical protein AB1489_41390, partial [Acidobacteriota bacterium]
MITLPTWMRNALFATAAMNIFAAIGFFPSVHTVRAVVGMPEGEHPFYLATVSLFVLLFGLGYLWTAIASRADRFFITLATAGKLSFFMLVVWFWITSSLPLRAVLAGSGDLIFGLLFLKWLYSTQPVVAA